MKQKKYGVLLATSMVVGTVIGSGIFFKSDEVLSKTGGNYLLSVLAWLCGGVAMVFGALVISIYASKVSRANGIVDYFEYTFNKFNNKLGALAGYITGWYMSLLYYPAIAAVVAWVAALYTSVLLGVEDVENSRTTWIIAFSYVAIIFLIAIFSRFISSIIQISATILKLIPLFFIAIVGTVFGLVNEVSFEVIDQTISATNTSFASAVVATAFAFDGWILATAINDELKDPKRDLPKALLFGTLLVLAIYVMYFTGMVASVGVDTIIIEGDQAVNLAFEKYLGNIGATILTIFIVISCLGTVNGLIMASSKASYQIALRGNGIAPNIVKKVDKRTDTAIVSSFIGLFVTVVMLLVWYTNFNGGLFGTKTFIDISSLPIVLNYTFLTILYIASIIQFKELKLFRRYIFPIFAICGASIIIYGGLSDPLLSLYIAVSAVIILCGLPFFRFKEGK